MNPKDRPKIDLPSIKKILCLRLRRIGDIVLTTPALSALKSSLFQPRVSCIVESPYRLLLEGNPAVDEIIEVSPKAKLGETLQLISRIRKQRFDVALDFHSGPRSSLLTFSSGARLKIGYEVKYRSFIYDIKIPRRLPSGPIHSAENHFNLIRALGIDASEVPPLMLPEARPEESRRIKNFLDENELRAGEAAIIHISAGNKFRDWGWENIVQLIELLGQTSGIRIILVGSNDDRQAEKMILKKTRMPVLSLVGELNLRELRELISRASLFIGPDSGPMHVAASTSVPIVALFGPTLPANFRPWRKESQTVIVEKELNCRPCKQRRCVTNDYRCLRSISAEEIYHACLSLL